MFATHARAVIVLLVVSFAPRIASSDTLSFVFAPSQIYEGESYDITLDYEQELIVGGKYLAVDLLDVDNSWAWYGQASTSLSTSQTSGQVTVSITINGYPPQHTNFIFSAFIAPEGSNYTAATVQEVQSVEVIAVPNGDDVSFVDVPDRLVPHVKHAITLAYTQELVAAGKYIALDLLDESNNWQLITHSTSALPGNAIEGEVDFELILTNDLPAREGYLLNAFIATNGTEWESATIDAEYDVEVWRDPQRLWNGDIDDASSSLALSNIPFWFATGTNGGVDNVTYHSASQALVLKTWDERAWQHFEVLPRHDIEVAGYMLRSSTEGAYVENQRGIMSLSFYDAQDTYLSENQVVLTTAYVTNQWHYFAFTSAVPTDARVGMLTLRLDGWTEEAGSDDFDGAGSSFDGSLWTVFGSVSAYRTNDTAYFPAQSWNWSSGGIKGDQTSSVPMDAGAQAELTVLGVDVVDPDSGSYESISYLDLMLAQSPTDVAYTLTTNLAVLRLHYTTNETYAFQLGVKTNGYNNNSPSDPYWSHAFSAIPSVDPSAPLKMTLRMTLTSVAAAFEQNSNTLIEVNHPVAFSPGLSSAGVGPVIYQANFDTGKAAFQADDLVLSKLDDMQPIYFDSLSIPTSIDTDIDRMPDWWEARYGFNTNSAVDADQDADSDGITNLEEYWLASNPTNSQGDVDADGMMDAWEHEHGLNPGSASDKFADADGDQFTNFDEYRAGTNPNVSDTDGDGVSDYVEAVLAFSNPLVVDFTNQVTELDAVNGSNIVASAGTWSSYATSIYAIEAGGSVSYEINAPTSGHFVLEVEAAEYDPDADNGQFDLTVYANGQSAGSQALSASFGSSSTATWFLPHIESGIHTTKVVWSYRAGNGRLRILGVRLLQQHGTDTNQNGIADWLDHRNAGMLSTESPAAQQFVSPLCYEGQTPLFDALVVTGSYSEGGSIVPQHGILDDWYANVPLSPTNDTLIRAYANNGVYDSSNTVTWATFNVLNPPTNYVNVRVGDSLLFNAFPVGASSGTVNVEIVGVTNYTTTIDMDTPHEFQTAGEFTVNGSWTNGTSSNATVTVKAVDASFDGPVTVWIEKLRTWDCANVPDHLFIESDPRTSVTSASLTNGGLRFTIGIDAPAHRYIVARLEEDGAVVDSAEMVGVLLHSSTEIFLENVREYEDGSSLIENVIQLNEVPSDIEIVIKIFAGGATFEDGTVELTLTAADFDENGLAVVRFVRPPGDKGSICHRVLIYQDDDFVGQR